PLRQCDDPQRYGLILQWLLDLLDDYEVPRVGEVQAYVSSTLTKVARRPAHERTITTLLTIMAEQSRGTELHAKAGRIDAQGISHPDMELKRLVTLQTAVRTVLKRLAMGGDYAGIFDATADDL